MPANRISYGTPEQLASLLRSIRHNVADEPDRMYNDPKVRRAAQELAEELITRLGPGSAVSAPAAPPAGAS